MGERLPIWIGIAATALAVFSLPVYMGIAHYNAGNMLAYSLVAGPALAAGDQFSEVQNVWTGLIGFAIEAAVRSLAVGVFGGIAFLLALFFL